MAKNNKVSADTAAETSVVEEKKQSFHFHDPVPMCIQARDREEATAIYQERVTNH